MKYSVVILVAVAAMFTAAPASAHLVAHHAKGASLKQIERSQKLNLAHASYVCHHGARQHKRWSCHAIQWLTRELKETEAALHPVVTASGYAPLCGSSCVYCESKFNSQAWNGNDYWGWYQFDYRTWKAHGGIASHWGSPSTSSGEQTAVARNVTYDAWPNC
jgi:hypothetical protein